jgi:peptidoglycan biosynthesis protein MviN/MurJ (putative lipid II flippase)
VIPHYGAVGAAISNGLTQFVGGSLTIYLLAKKVGLPFPFRIYIRILLVTSISCSLILVFTRWLRYNDIWGIIIGGILYLLIFCFLVIVGKLIQPEEFTAMKRLLNKGAHVVNYIKEGKL